MYTGLTNTGPSESYLPESNYYSGLKKSYSINNLSYFQQTQLAGANSSLKLNESAPAKSNSFLNSPISYYTGSVTGLNQNKIESGRATPSINNLNYLPRTASSFKLNSSAPAKSSSYLNSPFSYQTGSVASLNPNKDESGRATPSINNFSFTQHSQLPRTASSLKLNESNSFLNSPISYYTGSVASLNQNKIESGRATPSINNLNYFQQSKLSRTASSFKLNDSAPAPAKSNSYLNSPVSYYNSNNTESNNNLDYFQQSNLSRASSTLKLNDLNSPYSYQTGSTASLYQNKAEFPQNASAYNSYGSTRQTTGGPLAKTYSSYQLNLESTPEYAYEQEAQPSSLNQNKADSAAQSNKSFGYFQHSQLDRTSSSLKLNASAPAKSSSYLNSPLANIYSSYPEYTYELEQPQKKRDQNKNDSDSDRANTQNQSAPRNEAKSEQEKSSKPTKAESIANIISSYPEYTYELEQPQKQEAQPSLYSKQQNGSFYKQVKNFASSRAPTPVRSTYLSYDYSESKPDKRSALDKSSKEILDFFRKNRQSDETERIKKKLRDSLFLMLKDIFPRAGAYICGSSNNGFGTEDSDIDICLMVSLKELEESENFELLRIIAKTINKAPYIKNVEIVNAKVPIIKFVDVENEIDCDLNLNNQTGIRNTNLLKCYSKMDPRVQPLAIFAKHWAEFHDINDASNYTLSSYSITLMMLYYLQSVCQPAVIPNLLKLQPERFNSNTDFRRLREDNLPAWSSLNTESLAELFAGFLNYYAKFNFENSGISIRKGDLIPREEFPKDEDEDDKDKDEEEEINYILIEEPFDLNSTSRSIKKEGTYKQIVNVIRESAKEMEKSGYIGNILKQKYSNLIKEKEKKKNN